MGSVDLRRMNSVSNPTRNSISEVVFARLITMSINRNDHYQNSLDNITKKSSRTRFYFGCQLSVDTLIWELLLKPAEDAGIARLVR